MSKKSRFRSNYAIKTAYFANRPAFVENQKYTGVRQAGICFERKVGKLLEKVFGIQVVHNPWIEYEDVVSGVRSCCPDYLIIDVMKGVVTVVECKLSHTPSAWYQLNEVYFPVIQALFPGWVIRGLEVCKNYVRVNYPAEIQFVYDLLGPWDGGNNVMVVRNL